MRSICFSAVLFGGICLLLAGGKTVRADTLAQIRQEAAFVKSLRAEFTQLKHMKILSRPLISKGIVLFKSPGSIRWEYRQPMKSVLMMDNGNVRRYVEGDGGLVEDQGQGRQIMQFVLQEITHWMRGRFDSSSNFSAELRDDRLIVLTPRDASFSAVIQRIELKLSDAPGVMDRVRIVESPDNYTEYIFRRTRVNTPLDDRLFREY